jgi:hypothetical protein
MEIEEQVRKERWREEDEERQVRNDFSKNVITCDSGISIII